MTGPHKDGWAPVVPGEFHRLAAHLAEARRAPAWVKVAAVVLALLSLAASVLVTSSMVRGYLNRTDPGVATKPAVSSVKSVFIAPKPVDPAKGEPK